MKIAIITHHAVCNFGAQLQVLSTYSYLHKLGHDVIILDYRCLKIQARYLATVNPEFLNQHEEFCRKFIPLSVRCHSSEELIECCQKLDPDLIITGSDAVFRLLPSGEPEGHFPNPFWLTWVKKSNGLSCAKASLAASAHGANYYRLPVNTLKGIRAALVEMNFVSVRDRWSQLMVSSVTIGKIRPARCPDPLFMLNDCFTIPDEYMNEPANNKKQYLLLMPNKGFLTNDWVLDFKSIAHSHGLKVFSLPWPTFETNLCVDYRIHLPISPLGWYAWIQNAAGYIGSLFHPLVAAISNEVPFVSLDMYYDPIISIRSKVLDMCATAGAQSLVIGGPRVPRLSPARAFELLHSPQQRNANRYASCAREQFTEIIAKLFAEIY
ncbi:MAG: polysaccharide pyruvyl transferase family protein [Candidatus Krumholzibacteriota bacterium]|nr:polysaccharide pyruvyl transferase family protein [Candidatus Krumholzibacteriota bacterium]